MARLTQKRLIATLLSFSFLWVFMACVTICERETSLPHSRTELSSSALTGAQTCDGCPLSYFPKATTPERVKSILDVNTLSGLALIIPSANSHVLSNELEKPALDGSPPLRLLATLRI